MASQPSGNVHASFSSRETPWILPSNRKLRSITAVTIRNLNLSQPLGRPRGKTIDDQNVPTTLRTTTKMLAKEEGNRLGHSRSSNDLHSQASQEQESDKKGARTANLGSTRPLKDRLRRRSTLNWTNAPPRTRQERLEEATTQHMADIWFSLHCDGVEDPIYISEVSSRSMNPTFRSFDLRTYGPKITRQDELTVKFWIRPIGAEKYTLFVELKVNLQSLQFVGKSLESFHHPLPPNCILLQLADGVYTSFTDLPQQDKITASPKSARRTQTVQATSSFDALMRLSNLDDCVQDALATREKLASQISKLLEERKLSRNAVTDAAQAEHRLVSTNRSLSACRKQVESAKARRADLEASLQARRATIRSGQVAQAEAKERPSSSMASVPAKISNSKETKTAVSKQLRRICEDLLKIFPIESLDPKSLSFSIRDLALPNATSTAPLPDADPDSTAAALGLVAQVVQLLSLYLCIPVPYPPNPHGSASTIHDPISTAMPSTAARTFPLYQKGAVAYRFEYGVFLLNSDIELLMSRQGARVVDLRHTLPNLKYILTVLTDGKGELVGRKKGGVKAFQNGKAFKVPERMSASHSTEKYRSVQDEAQSSILS